MSGCHCGALLLAHAQAEPAKPLKDHASLVVVERPAPLARDERED
jgi:hypothetical protein